MRIVINTVIHNHYQSRPGYKQANQMNSDHDSRVHPNRNVRITSDPQIFQPKERTIVIPTISNSVRTVSSSFRTSKYLQCLSLKKVQVEKIFFVAFKILTRSIQEVGGRHFQYPFFPMAFQDPSHFRTSDRKFSRIPRLFLYTGLNYTL